MQIRVPLISPSNPVELFRKKNVGEETLKKNTTVLKQQKNNVNK
jgi:hypothetical protein